MQAQEHEMRQLLHLLLEAQCRDRAHAQKTNHNKARLTTQICSRSQVRSVPETGWRCCVLRELTLGLAVWRRALRLCPSVRVSDQKPHAKSKRKADMILISKPRVLRVCLCLSVCQCL